MILAGITGNIDSGKTTVANFMAESMPRSAHYESWQLIAEVANELRLATPKHPSWRDRDAINEWLRPLPGILQTATRKTVSIEVLELTKERVTAHPENYTKLFEYLELMAAQPELQAATISEATKETFRSLLQWLGGYLAKTAGGDIWYAELIRRIQANDKVDIVTIGGVRFPADAICVRQAGGSIISIERPDLARRDEQDLTEREVTLITPDSGIINNGSLEQLRACAVQVVQDLQTQNLQLTYAAGSFTPR
ncbi:MAG: hypothetical protein JWO35_431 [Candidatus Saccharibacteria bacterium]|nr:hypothetical protein [Candidatus Saccharibacteria bacterium]